ncbi:MAG: SDR family NAD(P)-dependent oxidoreductase [Kiritimatiellia bacterium]
MKDLPVKNMLIVGASGGIGRAIAEAARAEGWTCVGTSRREGAADVVLDCLDADGYELALMRLFTERGPFDAVVYCAGVCPVTPLSRLDAGLLAETRRVNCDAFLLLMKQFARPGAHAKEGAVAVAISSVSATGGWAGGVAYCASKGALSAACRALAVELAPKRIRVLAPEPSHVLTDMFRAGAGRMGVPASAAQTPAAFAGTVMAMIRGAG